MDLPELLKKLLASAHVIEVHEDGCDHERDDYSTWVQVARLGQEDITKRRAHDLAIARARQDANLLIAKLEAIKAKALADKTEWWNYVRQKYNLPERSALHIEDDHRILMRPDKEPER